MTSATVRRLAIALAMTLAVEPALRAQALPRAEPEEVGLSAQRLERLTSVLQEYVDDGRLAGGVALVARHGTIAYLEAFGNRDREAGAAMATDSLFRIASQSKALVSTAALMLQEEGRLLLSDPVSKYLPAFADTTVAVPGEDGGYDVVDADRPITLRHLLTHTSGIGYGQGVAADRWEHAGIQGWYFADRDEPIRATVDRLVTLPFDAQPGEDWVYGYSIDVLGAVLEVVTGQTLADVLRQRLFEPLGMTDTFFYIPPDRAQDLAVVYSAVGGEGIERAPDPGHMIGQGAYVHGPRVSYSGGAGLVSTATDYWRFLQMLLDGGTAAGKRLLSPTTVALMTTNHIGDLVTGPGVGFGLGFSVVTDVGARGLPGSLGEYGWGGAYHSTYWVDPAEQLVVVYLTQLIPAGDLDDHRKLRALVYAAIEESALASSR